MAKDIVTAIAGIVHVYTMSTSNSNDLAPKVLRSETTPWSAAPWNRLSSCLAAPKKDLGSFCVKSVPMWPPLLHLEKANITKIETSAIYHYRNPSREHSPIMRRSLSG